VSANICTATLTALTPGTHLDDDTVRRINVYLKYSVYTATFPVSSGSRVVQFRMLWNSGICMHIHVSIRTRGGMSLYIYIYYIYTSIAHRILVSCSTTTSVFVLHCSRINLYRNALCVKCLTATIRHHVRVV
jgi:hypothetical protein